MHSKLSLTHFNPLPSVRVLPFYNDKCYQIKCCDRNSTSSSSRSSSGRKFRFRLMGRARGGDKWKLNDIDGSAVQETLNQWLSKTQHFFSEVTSPLVKTVHDVKPTPEKMILTEDTEDIFMAEQTIESRTPEGYLSLAAVISVEQFSRMNGLTGLKMQKIFKTLVPESIYSDARNLVEYCCFRFLSRDSSEIHPYLKEPAFRKLIFITMLAWEEPYNKGEDPEAASGKAYLQKLVGKEAFVRVAPAVTGVADWSTVHSLFKALAGDDKGISFNTWSIYVDELLKVHEGRRAYHYQEGPQLSGERILCLGLSRKRPVLKWENNMAWPGKLTLTDKALYFEGFGFAGQKGTIRLDLTGNGARVEKTRVGPLGSQLFDSAVSITAGAESKTLVLEFVDLSGEMRRDVWYAFIAEVIALYKFIREFGPSDGDQSVNNVYGAHKGKARATTYAINGIARLQALQFIHKLLDDPIKLAQFSFWQSAPFGDIVCQTLAVNCWGGQLGTKYSNGAYVTGKSMKSLNEVSENGNYIFDVDGSVYLRKWMRSPSWASSASATFWKSSAPRKGVVLSKNLVVAGTTLVERATAICRERYIEVEKTQATIDAAMIEGIPSNIDLFKELLLPLTSTVRSIEKLRRWEDPRMTAAFLGLAYALLFRNLLSCIFPALLTIVGASLLLLKGLREQGRLGRYFGRVTIHDQPPSNTIQKILALKEAMREVEIYLQNLNVMLLKIRTILLAGQPQVTTEVALVLLVSSAVLLIVPFKYIAAFGLFDLFTRELEFRKPMVLRFTSMLKERWDAVPASPVVVLPYEGDETRALNKSREANDISESESFL